MKVLVTGSEGALMQEVIPLLLGQGHEVRGVDNFVRYGEIERDRNYEFIRGDLTDSSFAEEITRGVDGVIQAAAMVYGMGGLHRIPADNLSKDLVLHQNILWGMLKNDVPKILSMSSSLVYERCQTSPNKEEDLDSSLIPLIGYSLSKLVGERMVEAFAEQYGLKYVSWRPFNVMSPHEKSESEIGTSHVFADYIKSIVLEKKTVLPIVGDGEQIRCFTWIGDVARGIAEHSFSDKAENNAFNLGNPEPITMKNLAEIIYKGAQERGLVERSESGLQFETQVSFKNDVRIRIPDVSKAKDMLGWEPTLKVEESIGRCLDLIVSDSQKEAVSA